MVSLFLKPQKGQRSQICNVKVPWCKDEAEAVDLMIQVAHVYIEKKGKMDRQELFKVRDEIMGWVDGTPNDLRPEGQGAKSSVILVEDSPTDEGKRELKRAKRAEAKASAGADASASEPPPVPVQKRPAAKAEAKRAATAQKPFEGRLKIGKTFTIPLGFDEHLASADASGSGIHSDTD